MITTEAWILRRGSANGRTETSPGRLELEQYSFAELGPDEVLAEPLLGCWEANMTHALQRLPIDVAAARGEDKIVLGNAGVVRVAGVGSAVTKVREGDVCFLVPAGVVDRFGFIERVHGYDSPGTIGLLAKQMKLGERQLHPLPIDSAHSLRQWATYARYWTAWSNWKVAYGAWRTQVPAGTDPFVVAWGGGVSLAELELARDTADARVAMLASTDSRIESLRSLGITPIDRRRYADLSFDPGRYASDAEYKARYKAAEKRFLADVSELTDGHGVDIFIDNLGTPVYRATLRALARESVITTVGWKHGMALTTMRAIECIARRLHVHTHACGTAEIPEIVAYQEAHGWLPEVSGPDTAWEDIPALAQAYADGEVDDYFPIFEVNAA